MKIITIWQPWATLIAEGLKPYEWRGWPAPEYLHGKRIGIHAGARPVRRKEVQELLLDLRAGIPTGLIKMEGSIALLDRVLSGMPLPLSAIVCTAVMGKPRPAGDFADQIRDSDRIDHSKWAWPLTEIVRMQPPVPAAGLQGFWNYHGALEAA